MRETFAIIAIIHTKIGLLCPFIDNILSIKTTFTSFHSKICAILKYLHQQNQEDTSFHIPANDSLL